MKTSRQLTTPAVLDVISVQGSEKVPMIIVGILPLTSELCMFECIPQEGVSSMAEIVLVPMGAVANCISFSKSDASFSDMVDVVECNMLDTERVMFMVTWKHVKRTIEEGGGKPYRELI